ncbi:DUF2735 domain-containing protein [Neorhizobium sp. NPDC001467]|uniref:DUF2735 domain-containing protein n=1 Tax=Neorhizobium sp. NPDC001467 TaxID=3390595 RepID=UPI003D0061AE
MATRFERQTATVLQFPVGGRAGWHDKKSARIATVTAMPPASRVDFSDLAFGGAWYHEVALHDDDTKPTRNN